MIRSPSVRLSRFGRLLINGSGVGVKVAVGVKYGVGVFVGTLEVAVRVGRTEVAVGDGEIVGVGAFLMISFIPL
jgi:hypothetical protein